MKSECIEIWRNSFESFSTILKNSKENNSSIGKAILALMSEDRNEYNESDSRILAQKVFEDKQPVELNLHVLFLIVWSVVATNGGNLTESKMILNQIDAVDKNLLYPETIATILVTKGFLLSAEGNKQGRMAFYEKALNIDNLNKVQMEIIAIDYHVFLSGMGLSNNLNDRLEKIIKNISNKHLILRLKCNKLLNSLQVIEWKKKNSPIQEIKSDKEINSYLLNSDESNYKEVEAYSHFISDPFSIPFQNLNFDATLAFHEKWVSSTGYLFFNKPILGLKWARMFMSTTKGYLHYNLTSFTLIRAELSNKNCEAAKSLLINKIKNGYPHFLDDFFKARIALLDGNENLAKGYIVTLYDSCASYKAFRRLEFEVNLACELSAENILLFFNPLNTNTSKSKHINKKSNSYKDEMDVLVGQSPAIKKIKSDIKKVSKSKGLVLLTGETGVGKEVVSKLIHESSVLKDHPFIAINCGSIMDSLLQSELFGHEAGAFTGANEYQAGIFEAAENGTVFLDEIGEVSQNIQVALLRVLERKEIRPVGSTKVKKITCKIIVATNKNLAEMVNQNRFREDLFYRLNQLLIEIPPLRNRKEDILPLADHFLISNRSDSLKPEMSRGLKKYFLAYKWPGNVRQLKNEIEKMRLLNSEKLNYDEEDFPKNLLLEEPIVKSNRKIIKNQELKQIIGQEKTPLRRREKMIEFFEDAGTLTKSELMKMLRISAGTARTDLNYLELNGVIERIKPSRSTKSIYFKYCVHNKEELF